MFPGIEYDPLYSTRDRNLVDYVFKQIIREYARKLKPFDVWAHLPIKTVVRPPHDSHTGGLTGLSSNTVEINWPFNASGLHLAGWTSIMSHELAHHFISDYFDDTLEGKRLSINLVHYAKNTNTHQYAKHYWSPGMMFRVGLPRLTITMYDVRKLIDERDWIMNEILSGRAKGDHPYSV